VSVKGFVSGEFYGRDGELDTLNSVAYSAIKGNATGIFLSGDRGIGKTELLRQLFIRLSTNQDRVIPFYYTVRHGSLRDFSSDYLTRFIQHAVAFRKKDPSITHSPLYSPEDIRLLIELPEEEWALGVIDEYSEFTRKADSVQLFLYSISVPQRFYLCTGRPVVVMMDNFNRLKELFLDNHGAVSDCWMHMEEFINAPHTPHIITGYREELYDMLFIRTSIGEHLELMKLGGIDRESASRLFISLCNMYNLSVMKVPDLIERFRGNPLYLRKFVSALRRHGNMLHEDHLQKVYLEEIKSGDIFTYWLSHLKRYIPEDLRQDSLNLLYHLCTHRIDNGITISEASSIVDKENLSELLGALRRAGVIEETLTSFRLIDDRVFVDIIKTLYKSEKGQSCKVAGISGTGERDTGEGVFEVVMSAGGGSESIVLRMLQEVAQRAGVPSDVVGKLQIAMVEVMNSLFELNAIDRYHIRFIPIDDGFVVETDVPAEVVSLESPEGKASLKLIKGIVDDLRIEKLQGLTRVTMTRRFGKNPVHAPFL